MVCCCSEARRHQAGVYHYPPKAMQGDSDNKEPGDGCSKKVGCLVYGKGRWSQKISDTACETVMSGASSGRCTFG